MLPSPEDRQILHKRGGKKIFKPQNKIKPVIALVKIPVQVNACSHLLARGNPVLTVPYGSRHSEDCIALFPTGWDALMGLQHWVMWWKRLRGFWLPTVPWNKIDPKCGSRLCWAAWKGEPRISCRNCIMSSLSLLARDRIIQWECSRIRSLNLEPSPCGAIR